jgi:hypothetical protein
MKAKFILWCLVINFHLHFSLAQTTNSVYVNPQTMNTWNNPVSSYLDTVILNRINSGYFNQMVFSQMIFNQMMIDQLKTKFGQERIAKRQASTRFTPVAKNSLIEKSAANLADARERTQFIAANQQLLDTFQVTMQQHRLTPNDVADGRALAFVIAYQIFTGEFPGPQRLQALRQQMRQSLLADVIFQGTPDDEKQPDYEQTGIQSILAVYADKQAQNTKLSAAERARADQFAKQIAESILVKIWKKPAGSIEMTPTGFGNKAERLVKTGGGTITFKRTAEIASATRQTGEAELYKKQISRFDEEVRQRGGATNDLAFANAVAFDLAFLIVNDGRKLNAPQLKWLVNEMVKDMTNGPQAMQFQAMTDQQRQQEYEKLAIETTRLMETYNKLAEMRNKKSDDALTNLTRAYELQVPSQNMRSDARMLMRNIFQPRTLEEYELTESGFKKVR